MHAGAKIENKKIEIRRTFTASREKVFRAWTERERLEEWMCHDEPTHKVRYSELDVRPGGHYTIDVVTPEGVRYLGKGTFKEVVPPERLVFTWGWSRSEDVKDVPLQSTESLVTVTLLARGNSTEMVFVHEWFENDEVREATRKGWHGCFDVLEKALGQS